MSASLNEQVKCLEEEIKRREHVYPMLIEKDMVSKSHADMEIETMRSAYRTLFQLAQIVK